MSESTSFMDHVYAHERLWNEKTYPNRPSLTEIRAAPIVAIWSDVKAHQIITLPVNLEVIESYFDDLASRLAAGFPKRRLICLFVGGYEITFKLKVIFEATKQ